MTIPGLARLGFARLRSPKRLGFLKLASGHFESGRRDAD